VSERRYFLKVVAGCASAGLAGIALVPAVAFVSEPGQAQPKGEGDWTRLIRLDALEVGKPTRIAVVGAEIDAWVRAPDRRLGMVWLIRDDLTRIRAFSAVCPHLGCAIELDNTQFSCPCHDSAFSLNGERRTGPSPRGLDPLEVRIADEWVSVKYVRFRQGIANRVAL
jgi:menaquinol-cytochrome c reductase iron-sulfur subunit